MTLNDDIASIKVMGAILKNNELVEDADYPLNNDYFYNRLDIICFSVINNLYQSGLRNISNEHIIQALQTYPEQLEFFESQKGLDYLNHCREEAEEWNYSYFYNQIKKFALLRQYNMQGFDISPIYNINEIDPIKKQIMLERFNAADPDKINGYFEELLNNISQMFYSCNNGLKGGYAGDNLEELFHSLKDNLPIGLGLNGDLLNRITRGARLRKLYLRSSPSGVGKAIPNHTLIPTYDQGFKRVDEIEIGDFLIDRSGNPTKVLNVFPQENKKQIYKITFNDGRIAECCEDHLWTYQYPSKINGKKAYKERTESLKEILLRSNKYEKKYQNNDGSYIFRMVLNEPVNYKTKELPIDPYVFGLFLGDGSFRFDKTNKALSFSSSDSELPEAIGEIMNWKVKKNIAENYTYYFEHNENETNHINVWVEEFLEKYPDLINIKSEDKHIPFEYQLGDYSQRLELLRGLLDTDGNIDEKGRVRIDTISEKLANDIVLLCQSLGFLSNIQIDSRVDKYTTGVCYIVRIQTKKEIKKELFKLSRKKEIATKYSASNKREDSKNYNPIVKIEATNNFVDMTCFTVDNDDGLFLMNDYIVTHNTRTLVATASQLGVGEYYDAYEKQWIKTNEPQSVLYITSEQELGEIQTISLAFVSGVDEDVILERRETPEELERIKKAIELIKNGNLYIEPIGDYGIKALVNFIKKHKHSRNIQYVMHDYVHSSLTLMTEISQSAKVANLREDQMLLILMNTLKNLANGLELFIFTSTQLNRGYKDEENVDETTLRGAMSLSDKIDYGSVMLNIKKEELALLNDLIKSSNFPHPPNVVSHIFKNRGNKFTKIKLYSYLNKATGQMLDLFVLDENKDIVQVEKLRIIQK